MNSVWRKSYDLVIIRNKQAHFAGASVRRSYAQRARTGRIDRTPAAEVAAAPSAAASGSAALAQRSIEQRTASGVGKKSVSRVSQYSPLFRYPLSKMSRSGIASHAPGEHGRRRGRRFVRRKISEPS